MNLTPPKSTLFPYTTLFRSSGLWRSVTERGCGPTGSVTGCAARHEARHSPRLRLAPPCSHARPRPGVAELGVVRRRSRTPRMHEEEERFLEDAKSYHALLTAR